MQSLIYKWSGIKNGKISKNNITTFEREEKSSCYN